jgi:hypothetical protein
MANARDGATVGRQTGATSGVTGVTPALSVAWIAVKTV